MANIVVIGAGIGGLPAAYELRHLLSSSHQITLISASPKFTFIPSLPWVTMGLTALSDVQVDLKIAIANRGIELIIGQVTKLDPVNQEITVKDRVISYDFVIIATGAELALDVIPGLGPENGYTQSVCNPHHAEIARQAWVKFLENQGHLVVGAMPGAGCLGPVYEFALLADFVLRKAGKRQEIPITLITPEPYAGHLGVGGMANSAELVQNLLASREINLIENAAIDKIYPDQITLGDRQEIPFNYAMILPSFRGPSFARKFPGLADEKGFLPVLPTSQHPKFDSIYAAGVAVQIHPPEITPIPVSVPKTGQMSEAMAMAAAHNIALRLGEISGSPVKPTLEAICLADFGDMGIAFIASPVLPDPLTGKRRNAVALQGRWVSWSKVAFEKFFLAKMRWGLAVPWFEKLGLKMLGLSLVEPLE
jgi:sulfide:quinone oxidoreductase